MTNEELVARVQNGEDVFEELYQNNKGFIHKKAFEYSRKSFLEKEDLISCFMFVLYKCAHAYDINADNKFVTFFGTSMLRYYMKAKDRSEYKNVFIKTDSLNKQVQSSNMGSYMERIDIIPSHHEEFSYLSEVENACVETLSNTMGKNQVNMVMHYLCGNYSQRELSKMYNVSPQAVSGNVNRARVILKRELPKQGFELDFRR